MSASLNETDEQIELIRLVDEDAMKVLFIRAHWVKLDKKTIR